jgi:hypothetical protein
MKPASLLFFSIIFIISADAFSQKSKSKQQPSNTSLAQYDPIMLQGMRWRCIGPWRGGRSLAVSGVIQNDQIYYFGATGGGVWEIDGWRNELGLHF